MKESVYKNGIPVRSVLQKNNLGSESHPADFVNVFLPFQKNPYRSKNNLFYSIELFTKWTNQKAILAGAGDGGISYSDLRQRRYINTLVYTYSTD